MESPVTPPIASPVPVLSSAGPYRAHFPWLHGDASVVATDGSCDNNTMGAWAVVRGDGSSRFGWYTAPCTSSYCAELEAIRRALKLYERSSDIHLFTDSEAAIRTIGLLADGASLHDMPSMMFHSFTEELADVLPYRSVNFHVEHPQPSGKKRSPQGLVGVADRLAWTALQFGLHGIDVDAPDAQRWIASKAMQFTADRGKLRTAWRSSGHPGRALKR